MDVLSDAITAMRTGRPHSGHTHKLAPWGLRFPPSPGAGFHIVLRGSCWLLPPEDAPPVRLGVGDVVLLPRNRGYGLADSLETELIDVVLTDGGLLPAQRSELTDGPPGAETTTMLCGAYQLNQARPHPLLASLPDVLHLPAQVGRHPGLRSLVELLGAELTDRRLGTDAAVPALLDTLLLYILRAWFEESACVATSGWAAALGDPVVTAALREIHQSPAHPWTVEELGARTGLSRAAFARRFTALVGRPPLAYLTWWRMTTAGRLLRETDAPLRSVAQQTGYLSEFAFAKAFKREYDLSPGRYREQGRGAGRRSGSAMTGEG
ncbi:AraC family transcriptional regulator [Kitasatospora sp. NBC_01287]|uniref:AraC family transcriptional regulator n=1 Tax=Kitasatospora sp. NBC_01287 TaxID=2903573 RepID=UPI00224E15F2|nr:AraC family transcriptional regulator [Kitasatospora sp. NBC_01287]MCX4748621.1 AraC family transcriptional regulator [Kitasatospora sp. NBC_01287]